MTNISLLTLFSGIFFFIILFGAGIISFIEKEKRAIRLFFMLAVLIPAPYIILSFLTVPFIFYIQLALICGTIIIFFILFFPTTRPPITSDDIPNVQIDERDTMFARKDLVHGADNYEDYYSRNPEKQILDDKFRELPGLLNAKANQYHPLAFASADASFSTIAALKSMIQGEHAMQQNPIPADKMTSYIKAWAKKLGSVETGITVLKPYHLYSHKGRKDTYGNAIQNTHKYAIAFLVEMDREMIQSAPAASTVMESAQQYLNSGVIAIQVAELIRFLGYPATAHIDGNYEVVCPLVARDAGLGEIGRMGLLMAPKLGPRIRISVVTTDIPLLPDLRSYDTTVNDFCSMCKKCATACPANAIPLGERKLIDGALRWQISSEKCYTFWCQTGTDCSRCMLACPYSHPDTLMHNLVRFGIRNSYVFRKLAVYLENFLYGDKPMPSPLPNWIKNTTN